MQAQGCKTVEAYLKKIYQSQEFKDRHELLMTVSISRFFRDRRLWEALQREILPELASSYPKGLNVWSAGCACGEEVYSLKMVWEELSINGPTLPPLKMVATDMSPAYLEKAKRGHYPRSSLRELPDRLRHRYFEELPGKGTFMVKPRLKRNILWHLNHLLFDPPPSTCHLVFMRNSVLTYYAKPLRETALSKVLTALIHRGLLVIGSHEKIPGRFGDHVAPYRGRRWIFQVT
jgi:chemotaxis protein methyltransferase CheR